ncbi:MAG: hypothetical protein KAS39_03115 [Actinomycetia bacterium]|nr:hypothetical protein [Actinomycetes bacterium]
MSALEKFLEENGIRKKLSEETVCYHARVALYRNENEFPEVFDVSSNKVLDLIEKLSFKVYQVAKGAGGHMPFTPIREIVENLIHANFKDVSVSIFKNGRKIMVSDCGPGILDKNRATIPGFTTAGNKMRKHIRGIGSGLFVAKKSVEALSGNLTIEDNLNSGAVVTLSVPPAKDGLSAPSQSLDNNTENNTSRLKNIRLNKRQKKVLLLAAELGKVSPTLTHRELGVSLSTSYRDLVLLENTNLLKSSSAGKRVLTEDGVAYLDLIFEVDND